MQQENEQSVKAKLEEYIVLAESNHREITASNLKRWQASLEAERLKERSEVESIRTASERQVVELNARLAAMELKIAHDARESELRLEQLMREEHYQRCEIRRIADQKDEELRTVTRERNKLLAANS